MVLVAVRQGAELGRFETVDTDPNRDFSWAHRCYKRLCKDLGYTMKIQSLASVGFISYSNGQTKIDLKQVG